MAKLIQGIPGDTREAQMLHLADHVRPLIDHCAANMDDVAAYYRGSHAFHAIVHMLAGKDDTAQALADQIAAQGGGGA